jgi:hypothetical protein
MQPYILTAAPYSRAEPSSRAEIAPFAAASGSGTYMIVATGRIK